MNYIIIRKYILSFLLSIVGICYAELDLDSINEAKDWKFIQEGNINLKWTTYQGYPMCRVRTLLPYAIDSISKIIEDVENYPDIFKRVHNVQILEIVNFLMVVILHQDLKVIKLYQVILHLDDLGKCL